MQTSPPGKISFRITANTPLINPPSPRAQNSVVVKHMQPVRVSPPPQG